MSTKRGQVQDMADFFGYFKGLKEGVLESITNLQNYLNSVGVEDEITQEFLGASHGFLNNIDRFLGIVNVVEGKAKSALLKQKQTVTTEPQIATTQQEVMAAKRRIAQVSGEEDREKELDKKLKFTDKMKPGDRVHTTTMLERSDSVGSQYSPEFICEDIIRRVRGGNMIGAPYQTVQEAYSVEIEKDTNLSKEQKEKIKKEFAAMGYPIK